jgi:hypothetical protein
MTRIAMTLVVLGAVAGCGSGAHTRPTAGASRPAAAVRNRPPSVRARCEPCTVHAGQTSTVSAEAQDPDGDELTYVWTAPSGALAASTARQSLWIAPMVEGPVPVAVRVDDGKGGTASDVITVTVIK